MASRRPSAAAYIWYAIAAVILFSLTIMFTVGALSVSRTYCTTCHSTSVAAVEQTSHGSLRCDQCHMRNGFYGLVENRIAMVSMLPAVVSPASGPDLPVTNDTCLECHQAVLTGTVTVDGIRMSHAEVQEADWSCLKCHAYQMHPSEKRKALGTYSMGDCLECHNATPTNPGTCEVCHQGERTRSAKSAGEAVGPRTPWRITHGSNWQQTHGMGQLNTCKACHPENYCVRCHNMRMPHLQGFVKTHGRDVLSRDGGPRDCLTCHTQNVCNDCHAGIDMPHPAGFLKVHAQAAKDEGEKACSRCHDDKSCEACHTRHTHPGLKQDYLRELKKRPVNR